MLSFDDHDDAVFANNPVSLQSMLNDIKLYYNKYALKLNIYKTKQMLFERAQHKIYKWCAVLMKQQFGLSKYNFP